MSPSEDEARRLADGGVPGDQSQSPFETVADVEFSRADQYRAMVDEYVVAPGKIIWGDWRAKIGLAITMLFVLAGTVGVWLIPYPHVGTSEELVGPFQSIENVLGTDGMGRDILGQLVHATPAMLEMVTAGAVFAMTLAVAWGVFSGYKGGTVDQVMMAIADVLMTIPGLPLVVVLAAVLADYVTSPWMIGIILVVNAWAGFARALRSEVLKLRHESYVEASRTIGISVPAIIVKDILPNVMPLIVVNFVTTARNVIMASVGLYFLGLLPHTGFNWGVMLNNAYSAGGVYTESLFHWFYAPMITIVLFSLGLLLLGQGLDRIFNPKIRSRHAKQTSDEDGSDGDGDGDDDSTMATHQTHGGL